MKSTVRGLLAAFLITLAGCATHPPSTVTAGTTEAELVSEAGKPTARYEDGQDHLLEYALGPWGQKTYMARVGPDDRVISYEQVLTAQKFSTIKIDEATKDDVLRTIGAPTETSYLTLTQLEVWSYPYKESGVWNSLMHVHFDKDGIVRKMLNGPDPRFDPTLRAPLGVPYRHR